MDDFKNQIVNLFRQYKLDNSLFKQHFVLNEEEKVIINEKIGIDVDEFIRKKAISELSTFIVNQHINSFKPLTNNLYEIELLVLKMDDFKTIVEAAIQLIPQSEIDRIKSGEIIIE